MLCYAIGAYPCTPINNFRIMSYIYSYIYILLNYVIQILYTVI